MLKPATYICDMCLTPKPDAEEWLLAYTDSRDAIKILKWDEGQAVCIPVHLCSAGCAGNWAARQAENMIDRRRMVPQADKIPTTPKEPTQ